MPGSIFNWMMVIFPEQTYIYGCIAMKEPLSSEN